MLEEWELRQIAETFGSRTGESMGYDYAAKTIQRLIQEILRLRKEADRHRFVPH